MTCMLRLVLSSTVCPDKERVESQEIYTRRDNVILYNVKGDMNESQSKTCEKIITILNQCVPSKTWSKSEELKALRGEGKFGFFKNGKLQIDKNEDFTNNSKSQPGS